MYPTNELYKGSFSLGISYSPCLTLLPKLPVLRRLLSSTEIGDPIYSNLVNHLFSVYTLCNLILSWGIELVDLIKVGPNSLNEVTMLVV